MLTVFFLFLVVILAVSKEDGFGLCTAVVQHGRIVVRDGACPPTGEEGGEWSCNCGVGWSRA